jgi:carbamoyl-phosphate synthase small subunit
LKKAVLALADGTVFEGFSLGADGEAAGEVVFNTSMTGYQEVLTDPSYRGQIVVMTCPQQGNYGVNDEDIESSRPWVQGFVAKEPCLFPSNWRSQGSLRDYMSRHSIVGVSGIDTRALTRIIRDRGAMQAVVSTTGLDPKGLVEKARASRGPIGEDLVKDVTCRSPYAWDEPLWDSRLGYGGARGGVGDVRFRVVAYDYGMKRNILRCLTSAGCSVTVVPADTLARDVIEMGPHGVFLSNGPGDPAAVGYAIENVRGLIGKAPIFGICLGHQILALALGGRTFKLKFGHRGSNHPVKDLKTGRVEITSQNHGFAVDMGSLGASIELTHVNLNDNTVEGLSHRDLPLFSVQYHPEASPGPHDSMYLFERFTGMMARWAGGADDSTVRG